MNPAYRERWKLCSLLLLLVSTTAFAQAEDVGTPRIHSQSGDSTQAVQWQSKDIVLTPSRNPGIGFKALIGDTKKSGLYLVRVRMEPGALNPPHVHPDARVTTVISGTVYYGTGSVADRHAATAFGPGSVYFTPAGAPHWVMAGDEPAVYEEVGFGPSETTALAHTGR